MSEMQPNDPNEPPNSFTSAIDIYKQVKKDIVDLKNKMSKNVSFQNGIILLGNVPTPGESIFKLCTASQRPYTAKSTKYQNILKLYIFI